MSTLILALLPLLPGAQAPPGVSGEIRHWYEPAPPAAVAGPIYYVGTRGLCVYLIRTPEGHILIDGAMPPSAPLIEDSIRKLGFRPEDIRLILNTHAHVDHAGTIAHFQKLSGARVAAIDAEVELLASGGKLDYLFARREFFRFPPVHGVIRLRHGQRIGHGGVTLTAHHTPGHTRGCATYTTTVQDRERTYSVVFPCSTSLNPGTRLRRSPSYPGIEADYRRSIEFLGAMKPDIFLPGHVEAFGFAEKAARAAREGAAAFADPEGYRRWIAQQKSNFETAVRKEQAAP
jgi:metallo-beta-lactamase class B